jgi:uncharacterized membrane protein YgcG
MKAGTLLLLTLLWANTVTAEVRELSQADLRLAVAENRAIRSIALIAGVERFTGGDILDIPAFAQCNAVTYRILYRDDAGAIATLMVDGDTGRAVNLSSDKGQSVLSFASANPPSTADFGIGNFIYSLRASVTNNGNANQSSSPRNSGGVSNSSGKSNGGGNNAGGDGNGGGNSSSSDGRGNGRKN